MFDNAVDPEGKNSIPLIQNMLIPDFQTVQVAPDVNTTAVSSFVGNVDFSLTYNIAANAAPNPGTVTARSQSFWTDTVSYNKGMYISFPQHGVDSVYHYGFVESGSYVQAGTAEFTQNIRGLSLLNAYVGPKSRVPTFGPNDFVGWRLEYNSELGLPRIGAGIGFQIEPELATNYSKLRAFASKMVMSSTTISGTNFNLSGTFSSGVIADTRNICQVVGANGVRRAFPQAALSQQSITKGDVLRSSSVAEGAVDLMGPDYPRYWTQPDTDTTDTLYGQWETPSLAQTSLTLFNNVDLGVAAQNAPYDVAQYWVTPWDTDFWVTNGSTTSYANQKPTIHEVVKVNPINEEGVLDIDFSFSPSFWLTEGVDSGNVLCSATMNFCVNAVHLFAYCGGNGMVNYNVKSETELYPMQVRNSLQLNGASNNSTIAVSAPIQNITFKSRPRMLRPSFATTDGGKYLGTLISVTATWVAASTHTKSLTFAQPPTASETAMITGDLGCDVRNMSMRVRGRNVDKEGTVGIAHIIRYDDVTEGQQVQFQGSAIVQGVAQGSLMPFVTKSVGVVTLPETLVTKLLNLLWGRNRNFRRICTLREYRDTIAPAAAELTPAKLLSIINNLDPVEREVALNAAASGGFFGPLAKMAGTAIGGLFGQPALGGQAGELVGGIGDGIFGTGSATYGQRPWSGRSDTIYLTGNAEAAGNRRQRDM